MKTPVALLVCSLLLPAASVVAAAPPAASVVAAPPPAVPVGAAVPPVASVVAAAPLVEDLLGIALDFERGELTVQVVSTGCTDRNSFVFQLRDGALTVVRTRKDECKRMPERLSLVYPLAEAGIDPNKPFTLVNALLVNPHLVRRP